MLGMGAMRAKLGEVIRAQLSLGNAANLCKGGSKLGEEWELTWVEGQGLSQERGWELRLLRDLSLFLAREYEKRFRFLD